MRRGSLATTLVVLGLALLAPSATAREAIAYFGTEAGSGTRGGEFTNPGDLAVNPSGVGPADPGDVYVLDRGNNRIQRFHQDDNGTPADPYDDTYPFVSAWGVGVLNGAVNETQTIARDATGGTFRITFKDPITLEEQTTTPIPYNAVNEDIWLALKALPAIRTSSNVVVNNGIALEGSGGPWTITFVNELSAADLPEMTCDPTGLAGEAASCAVSTEADGAGAYEVCDGAAKCRAGSPGGESVIPGDGTKNGALGNPQGVAIDPDSGEVYVSDATNNRVDVYDGSGVFLRSFGYDVIESGPSDNGTSYEVCLAGQDVCKRGLRGSAPGQIGGTNFASGAGGIALTPADGDPGTGTVYLADLRNNRVDTYELDGQSPADFGAGSGLTPAGGIAIDSRGIVYLSVVASGSPVARYDSQNANGGGVGFLEPIGVPPLTHSGQVGGLEVDPDSDSGGSDTDVLYVLRNIGGSAPEGIVQQFGPLNPPGLTAPPAAEDALHGAAAGFNVISGLGLDEGSGRLFVATNSNISGPESLPEDNHGVYVLDTAGALPTATLDSLSDITASTVTLHGTIDPNGPPVVSYRAEYSLDGTSWTKGPEIELGTQEDPQTISVTIDPPQGLTPGTFYHVRLVATKRFAKPVPSDELTFTTDPSPPLVETIGAPVRSATTATLNARVNPRLAATQFHLEYASASQFAASGFAGAQSTPTQMVGVNEVQKITVTGTSGQFKLTYEAQSTPDLPVDTGAAAVQSALEALPGIGTGNVRVRGGTGNPRTYTVIFTADLAATDASDITASDGTAPLDDDAGGAVTTLTQGGGGKNEIQQLTIRAAGGLYRLSFGAQTTAPIEASASAEVGPESVRSRLGALSTIGGVANLVVSGGPGNPKGDSPYAIEFKGTLTNKDLGQLSVSEVPAEPLEISKGLKWETTVAGGPMNLSRLVSARVSGLAPATSYVYRVVADNGTPGSPAAGEPMALTTRASDMPLSHGDFPGPAGSDRAYEQINLPDTGGNPVSGTGPFAPDGNRAIYAITGGTPVSETGTEANQHFAERTSDGWQTREIFPPRSALLGANLELIDRKVNFSAIYALNTTNTGERRIWRLAPDAPAAKIWELGVGQEIAKGGSGVILPRVASEIELIAAMLKVGGTNNIYDVNSSPSPQLLSPMPDGEPAACGVTPQGFELTADGQRLFFMSSSDGCGSRPNLYLRDIAAGQTKLLSGPVLSGADCGASLIRANGEAAFFFTQSRLAAEDSSASPGCPDKADGDVYRYDLVSEAIECVTCLTAESAGVDADVYVPFNFGVPSPRTSIAVAPDGSRVYFQSPHPLLPGAPTTGENSLYVTEPGNGELRWVASVSFGQSGNQDAISPDGATIQFRSDDVALNPVGGTDNGGTTQDYRYDDRDRSLICVSCPVDGSEPQGAVSSLDVAALSDSGGHLAFATPSPLVDADQNTAPAGKDPAVGMDVYEWREGRLFLMTDGLSKWRREFETPAAAGMSPSGHDLYFLAATQLTPDALDGYRRLYTARIGGGIDFPVPKPPCALEVCQGTPRGGPVEAAPGTESFHGAGNPGRHRPPCPKGKRRLRRNGQVRCVKRHAKHHRGAAR